MDKLVFKKHILDEGKKKGEMFSCMGIHYLIKDIINIIFVSVTPVKL